MKRFWIAPVLVVTLYALSASAQYASNNSRTVMGRLDSMERNLQLLQRQVANGGGGELPEGVEPSDAAAGSLQSQIAELQENISKIRGELEQVQYQNRQLKDQFDRAMKDTDLRLQEMEKKLAAAPAPIAAAPTTNTIGSVPVPENAGGEQPEQQDTIDTSSENPDEGGTQTPPSPPPSTVKSLNRPDKKPPGAEFANSREHYNAAFRKLNEAKYAEAGTLFQSFVKTYPKDPLSGNAFYWLGETHYVQRDYVKAADSFRQGFEALPAGPKAPDNLLKLSMSLNAMKRDKEACVVLKQLVAKFGKSSQATKEKAQAEISRIGCE